MLIHVRGTIFTDSESGATIDAARAVEDNRRATGEIRQLRESLGSIALAVLDACKRQVEKGRSLDNVNLDALMNRVLDDGVKNESAPALHMKSPEGTVIGTEERQINRLLDASVMPPDTRDRISSIVRSLSEKYESAREMLGVIVLNAKVQPDISMGSMTDCYAVPLDDIENADSMLKDFLAAEKEQTIEGRLAHLGFEHVDTGGGFSALVKSCANGNQIVLSDRDRDTADISNAEKVAVAVYRDAEWRIDGTRKLRYVEPAAVEETVTELLHEYAMAPEFAPGQKFEFSKGQRVIIANGLDATIIEICSGKLQGMVVAEVPGSTMCVSATYPECYPAVNNGIEVVTHGRYLGSIMEIGAQFVVQDCGRGRLVAHEKCRFDEGQAFRAGTDLFIEYSWGKANIKENRGIERGEAIEL